MKDLNRVILPIALLFVMSSFGCVNGELDRQVETVDLPDSSDEQRSPDTNESPTPDPQPGPDTGMRSNDTGMGYVDTGQRPDDTGHTQPDTGTPTTDTGTSRPDTSTTRDTGTNTQPCGGRCGTNASCNNGTCTCNSGFTGDPYSSCQKPMQGQCTGRADCGSFAVCIQQKCECEPGFIPKSGGGCKRPTVGDPANRTKTQVCKRWKQSQGVTHQQIFAQQPANQCDPGKLKPKVQWEAIDATNIYRWLVGLDPVESKASYIEMNQHCATAMAAKGTLTHNLKMSDTCYTQKAASGAGSSNIAMGSRHPAGSVRQYIQDRGNPNLGHRRWIFSPRMGATGFGQRGRFGCMYSFDRSGRDSQSKVRYPSRGPFPKAALHGPWSFLETSRDSYSNAKVEVVEQSTGTKMSVSGVRELTLTYGRVYGVSWQVSGASAGESYKVTISNIGRSGGRTETYTTKLVGCR